MTQRKSQQDDDEPIEVFLFPDAILLSDDIIAAAHMRDQQACEIAYARLKADLLPQAEGFFNKHGAWGMNKPDFLKEVVSFAGEVFDEWLEQARLGRYSLREYVRTHICSPVQRNAELARYTRRKDSDDRSKNVAIEKRRSEPRARVDLDSELTHPRVDDDADHVSFLEGLSNESDRERFLDYMEEAFQSLKPEDQKLLAALGYFAVIDGGHYSDWLSVEEIAEQLSVSKEAVNKRVQLAKKRLVEEFKREVVPCGAIREGR